MKKNLLLGTLFGTLMTSSALAQNYNPYSPSNMPVNYGYYNYNQNHYNQNQAPVPAARVTTGAATEDFKRFSIGVDYVFATTSMIDRRFTIENPLLGGNPYQGKTSDFEDNIHSLNGNIGFRAFKYLGFEAFYQHSLSDNQIRYQESYALDSRFAQAEYSVKYQAFGVDAIFYLPVASRLELIGTLGLANYDFTAEAKLNAYSKTSHQAYASNPAKFSENEVGMRAGAGAQFRLSNRLALRAMYRYVSIGGENFDDLNEISLGVRYNF